ncbi:aldehyde dehydrogenase family protein [Pseudomonas sp. Gutcm_11s]|uniref:aldehyde dehydrogenase family protein n=1 Tax=Pseudomonas sp. Gutcm_11s TaxID=3026088 RepID=UPI0023602686|nr:aldehyde dehydrogenase family protein [Pseudomonas sp. Gutcm_11s]MDD0843481.1 aldehyde dehydrogenase family protein [Pseudomonas sp. Gutcm_11s]
MTFIEREQQEGSDAAAIARLRDIFDLQKRAFLDNPAPSLAQRLELLGALANMMLVNRQKIQEAIAADFSSHPRQFADLVECLGVAGRAQYVAEHLAGWMQAQERNADAALYGSGKAMVVAQPKGVVGNMAPWNFPFDIGIGPAVEMLAAGNRVIIKPSDLTPACSELTLEMIRSTFDPAQVAAVAGGLELAKFFPTLNWDHLMYTGSTEVGRSIAVAAAQNLVPVTLELGGKCPALIAADGLSARNVEQIIGCKTIKNGQMCVTVDYVLVPHAQRDQFVSLVREHMHTHLPDYSKRPDTTGIINQRHLQRLQDYLADAVTKGATLVQLGGDPDDYGRRMPLTLVLDVSDDMLLMQHEIFGPILPIKTYGEIAEAVNYINAGERPLGIYVFTETPAIAEQVLAHTVSGGVCINSAALHAAMPCLPFGGVGKSGSGRHHGHEGFLEFSNLRSVFYRGENDLVAAMFAPYGELADAVIARALGQA